MYKILVVTKLAVFDGEHNQLSTIVLEYDNKALANIALSKLTEVWQNVGMDIHILAIPLY